MIGLSGSKFQIGGGEIRARDSIGGWGIARGRKTKSHWAVMFVLFNSLR